MSFRVRRVYDEPDPGDGRRILVDRLWPRGLAKERAHVDEWAKDVTPSNELRRWFHADRDARRAGFEERYRAELDDHAEAVAALRAEGERGTVTLLTATKDPGTSHVPVLLARLESPA
ncbi:DUF488 domain-containing protein [Actinorhabdospora filicis]|uniref:DUF488 domain-containing protein n=1 Tax=Actinorhabdospora filicis TaxID=1785913 RepID=UPI0025523165|nr:DUF488 family protein [Actinorhabdospora filicis]